MNRRSIFAACIGAFAGVLAWIKPKPHRIVSTRCDWNEEAHSHFMFARTDQGGWLPLSLAKYFLVKSLLGIGVQPLAHKIERFSTREAVDLMSDPYCMNRAKEMFS